MAKLETISFVGAGRVGRTLARAAKDAGFEIGLVVSRHEKQAKQAVEFIGAGQPSTDLANAAVSGSVHFITTNDDSIAAVARQMAEGSPQSLAGHYYFHTSGAITSEVLEPLKKKGAEIGSIHPLQVFADPEKALETLPGIYYAIEGSDKAMMLAVQFVDRLQGKLLLVPTGRKVLYHVAGVFAANYLTVLVNLAVSIMEEIGEPPEEAYQAFLPLMVGALQNIEEFGVAGALTGPISRGDNKTIEKHLEALRQMPEEVTRVYKVLGQQAVELAARHGSITADKARQLLALMTDPLIN